LYSDEADIRDVADEEFLSMITLDYNRLAAKSIADYRYSLPHSSKIPCDFPAVITSNINNVTYSKLSTIVYEMIA